MNHQNRGLMEIRYTETALLHRDFWKRSGQTVIMNKISSLIASIEINPEKGIGKPEQLKYELSGVWSRRIDRENRLIYEIHDDYVLILAMKGHYEK